MNEQDLYDTFDMYDFCCNGTIAKRDVLLICEYDLNIITTHEGRKLTHKMINSVHSESVTYDTFKSIVKRLTFLDMIRKRYIKNIQKSSSVPLHSLVSTPHIGLDPLAGESVLKNALNELSCECSDHVVDLDLSAILQIIEKEKPTCMKHFWDIILNHT